MTSILIRNALRQIGQQPFRTLLVLQGVIWGTALGIFPPALIHGSFKKAETDAAASGINRVLVTLERRDAAESYTWDDIDWLRKKYAGQIAELGAYGVLSSNGTNRFTVLATDAHAPGSRALQLVHGRFFTGAEVRAAAKVCVLDAKVAGTTRRVGQRLTVAGHELEIIGIARPAAGEELDEFGYDNSHVMSQFIKGLQRNLGAIRSGPAEELNRGECVMVPRTLLPEAQPAVFELRAEPRRILDLRDQLRGDLIAAGYQPVIFTNALLPFLYRQTLDTFAELNRAVFLLCVIVGTCVVCVLMVLSVVERQREIAIRRVEGARRWHVGLQFVVETGTICAVGGLLGVPLGLGLAAVRVWLEPLGAVTWAFPPLESLVCVTLVTLIGLLGGLLPAWRAMQLDPVEVLRHE